MVNTASCNEGYAGQLCSACDDGFYRAGRICVTCSLTGEDEAELTLLIVYAAGIFVAFGLLQIFLDSFHLAVATSYFLMLQQISIVGILGAPFLSGGVVQASHPSPSFPSFPSLLSRTTTRQCRTQHLEDKNRERVVVVVVVVGERDGNKSKNKWK